MHGGLCDCCRCDKAESRRVRLTDETVDMLPSVIEAGIDDFLSETIDIAASAAGYDSEDLGDFTGACIEALIRVAAARYRAVTVGPDWTPAMASAELVRIVRAEGA